MESKKENGFGIAAMVLGIIGLVTSCIIIGIVPSLLGFIFSLIALGRKNSKQGTSVAGLVCSIIGLLISILMIIVLVVSDDDSSTKEHTQTMYQQEKENRQTEDAISEIASAQCEYKGLQLKYASHSITEDRFGDKILTVYYEFTNNTNESQSFDTIFSDTCYQNGIELKQNYFGEEKEAKNYSKKIKPGSTLVVTTSFSLEDCMDAVVLEVEPFLSLNENILMSVNIELQ